MLFKHNLFNHMRGGILNNFSGLPYRDFTKVVKMHILTNLSRRTNFYNWVFIKIRFAHHPRPLRFVPKQQDEETSWGWTGLSSAKIGVEVGLENWGFLLFWGGWGKLRIKSISAQLKLKLGLSLAIVMVQTIPELIASQACSASFRMKWHEWGHFYPFWVKQSYFNPIFSEVKKA